MELMGLTIIVILIILGILFAIKFVILKKPPETKASFTRSQMTSNLGMAILQSTSKNCKGTDVTELMTDCAQWIETGGLISCEDGRNSCRYVNETVAWILNSTLVQWKVKYYVSAGTSKNPKDPKVFEFSNLKCKDNQPGNSELFFLPTDRGVMTVKIFICS
ncbi:hypothetical protein HY772_06490 [Candidatus Woesearchaeota archaeon]|nr:hypothetical protein [Candidatus Woesearchaeota archaeon]